MARIGITQEQVFDTAERLRAEQQPVNVQSVRAALGAGSFTTISVHLRRWQEQAQLAAALTAPPELEAVARRAVHAIWHAAAQISCREIELARHRAQVQVEEMQQHYAAAVQEIARLETHTEQTAAHSTTVLAEIQDLREALAKAQASAAAQQARATQLDARVDELKAELNATRAATEDKSEECGRLRGELAALRAVQRPPAHKANGRAGPTPS